LIGIKHQSFSFILSKYQVNILSQLSMEKQKKYRSLLKKLRYVRHRRRRLYERRALTQRLKNTKIFYMFKRKGWVAKFWFLYKFRWMKSKKTKIQKSKDWKPKDYKIYTKKDLLVTNPSKAWFDKSTNKQINSSYNLGSLSSEIQKKTFSFEEKYELKHTAKTILQLKKQIYLSSGNNNNLNVYNNNNESTRINHSVVDSLNFNFDVSSLQRFSGINTPKFGYNLISSNALHNLWKRKYNNKKKSIFKYQNISQNNLLGVNKVLRNLKQGSISKICRRHKIELNSYLTNFIQKTSRFCSPNSYKIFGKEKSIKYKTLSFKLSVTRFIANKIFRNFYKNITKKKIISYS